MNTDICIVILGNQLFELDEFEKRFSPNLGKSVFQNHMVYMSEDFGFCTELKYHKQRLHFFISSMRLFSQKIKNASKKFTYFKLDEINKNRTYVERFLDFAVEKKIKHIAIFEIEDEPFETQFLLALKKNNIKVTQIPSPMFLSTRDDFRKYLASTKKPFMKTFYEQQRKTRNILMEEGKPKGGQFSFDSDNRLKLPENITPPSLPNKIPTEIEIDTKLAIESFFPDHPGNLDTLWLPTDHKESREWLETFLTERFEHFGAYEDALAPHSDFAFHSVLTPMLNSGLLTPEFVIGRTIEYTKIKNVPLSSIEGFIRQIMGWREFIRGIYQNFGKIQKSRNFWAHGKKLSSCWYDGTTGIEPLDSIIKKALKYGYCHHIERLMVVSNMMVLCEIEPLQAFNWFMEMFVDSSDWVMVPNVYGMGLFSDSGIFATKPYICGSNYWVKMGAQKNISWSDGVDGLYWKFIEKNRTFFEKNHRLSMMPKLLNRMDENKKVKIFASADRLMQRLTTS